MMVSPPLLASDLTTQQPAIVVPSMQKSAYCEDGPEQRSLYLSPRSST
jgi:hypothetical protein